MSDSDVSKSNGENKPNNETGPVANSSDVFSKFGRTPKVFMLRFFGVLFSIISGAVYPIMAFYWAKSSEDLGGMGDDYMAQVRELVFTFLILG
jgi:hypothetical protein